MLRVSLSVTGVTRLPHIPRSIEFQILREISPSKYTLLANGCAYSFLYQRALNSLGNPSRLMPPRSFKNEIGSIIHRIFELINNGALSPNKTEIKAFWKNAICNAEKKIKEQYPSLRNLNIVDYNAMFTTIKVAVDMGTRSISPTLHGRTLEHPNEHYLTLPGLLKGAIDRIDLTANGTYRIVDYKSGGVYEEEGSIKKDYVDQLNLYAYMLEEAESVSVSSLAIIDKDGEFIDVPYYPANKQKALSQVRTLLRRINTAIEDDRMEDLFSPGEKSCLFCPVYHLCPKRFIYPETVFKILEGTISRIWNDDQLELTQSDGNVMTIAKLRILEIDEWTSLVGKEAIFVNLLEINEGRLYNRTDNTVIYIKD